MLKQRQQAAENLAKKLFAAEQAIDGAISKMADLTGYMPIARTNAHLSAVVGQDALQAMAMGSGDMKPPAHASVQDENILNMVDHAA